MIKIIKPITQAINTIKQIDCPFCGADLTPYVNSIKKDGWVFYTCPKVECRKQFAIKFELLPLEMVRLTRAPRGNLTPGTCLYKY